MSPLLVMASSSSALCKNHLQCFICLDVFTDPVSTPCGHNFCMICLKTFWDSSSDSQCPVCKEEFPKRPELRVNAFISGVAASFKSVQMKSSSTADERPSKPKKVLCDSCTEEKLEAVMSCLHCGVSFCDTHLILHKTTTKLMKHKLMEPVENLEDYICQKHERPLELFCRDDQMCVCQFCTEGDHRTHNTVPMEEEIKERKIKLEKTQAEVQQMIQERWKKIEEIQNSVKFNNKNTEKEKVDVVEIFSALMRSIERSQVELPKKMEEKQEVVKRQAEEFIKDLEQEITELKRRNTELEQLSHTEDHIHLLQIYPSLCSPPHTQDWTDVTITSHLSVEPLGRIKIQETFNKNIEKLIEIELKRIQQYAVDVTLDPDTANPYLILSNDGKQVTHGDKRQNVPDNPERFEMYGLVLGKEGFSSGRFYYEVQVKAKTEWELGVVRESINRKGTIRASPEDGFWCVLLRNENEYKALDSPPVSLSLKQAPQKVGVFVDYEEGLISFYDVDAKSDIYSFTGQTFTEKLHPCFCPCVNKGGRNSTPLIISPVRQI
ncbi:E3 ubiquitin-protein ligase TRIM39-like [Clarias gariepinus]